MPSVEKKTSRVISMPAIVPPVTPGGAVTDEHINNVVLLLGFEGSDGATSTSDESPANQGSAVFVNLAQIDTAEKAFGGSSLRCNAASDCITFIDKPGYDLSDANSDQFTIECWVKWEAQVTRGILGQWGVIGNRSWALSLRSGDVDDLNFGFSTDGTAITDIPTTGGGITTGQWYHLCVDKDSTGKIRIYINGVMRGSSTPANSTFHNSTNPLSIGLGQGADGDLDGWIDEVRITKGVARYASDAGFTIPTSAYPRI